MKINFKIAAGFGHYLSDVQQYISGISCEVKEPATVDDLLKALLLPHQVAMHIFINGRMGNKETALKEGDQVYLGLTTAGG